MRKWHPRSLVALIAIALLFACTTYDTVVYELASVPSPNGTVGALIQARQRGSVGSFAVLLNKPSETKFDTTFEAFVPGKPDMLTLSKDPSWVNVRWVSQTELVITYKSSLVPQLVRDSWSGISIRLEKS